MARRSRKIKSKVTKHVFEVDGKEIIVETDSPSFLAELEAEFKRGGIAYETHRGIEADQRPPEEG